MKNYSQTYIGIIVSVLASILPRFGVTIGSEELTTTISVIIMIAGAVWALFRRYQAGGVNVFGVRK